MRLEARRLRMIFVACETSIDTQVSCKQRAARSLFRLLLVRMESATFHCESMARNSKSRRHLPGRSRRSTSLGVIAVCEVVLGVRVGSAAGDAFSFSRKRIVRS